MSNLTIHMFPCLADNYGYLLHDAESGATAAVDTPDAAAIEAQLDAKGWRLTHILNTHHHADHAGGNLELKRRTGCTIVGPRADAARIPGIDVAVGEGDVVALGSASRRGVRHAGPHARTYRLPLRRESSRIRRRHVVRARLRQAVRRHARADVELVAEDSGSGRTTRESTVRTSTRRAMRASR